MEGFAERHTEAANKKTAVGGFFVCDGSGRERMQANDAQLDAKQYRMIDDRSTLPVQRA
jgi:hypothetical protein